ALRDPVLDEVADHDEQDHVGRLHRRELAPAHHTHQEENEDVRDECSENDVHQGKIVILRWTVRIGVSPSSSSTFCDRRPTFVGLTCNDMKKITDCPAGMCPNPYARRPLRSASVRGWGASPLTV